MIRRCVACAVLCMALPPAKSKQHAAIRRRAQARCWRCPAGRRQRHVQRAGPVDSGACCVQPQDDGSQNGLASVYSQAAVLEPSLLSPAHQWCNLPPYSTSPYQAREGLKVITIVCANRVSSLLAGNFAAAAADETRHTYDTALPSRLLPQHLWAAHGLTAVAVAPPLPVLAARPTPS